MPTCAHGTHNLTERRCIFCVALADSLVSCCCKGEEVAVYSIADRMVWEAVPTGGKGFWVSKPNYLLRGLAWKLGDVSLPGRCLFKVEPTADGKYIKLYALDRGRVERKGLINVEYRLHRGGSKLYQASKPAGELTTIAIRAAITTAMGAAVSIPTAGLTAGLKPA